MILLEEEPNLLNQYLHMARAGKSTKTSFYRFIEQSNSDINENAISEALIHISNEFKTNLAAAVAVRKYITAALTKGSIFTKVSVFLTLLALVIFAIASKSCERLSETLKKQEKEDTIKDSIVFSAKDNKLEKIQPIKSSFIPEVEYGHHLLTEITGGATSAVNVASLVVKAFRASISISKTLVGIGEKYPIVTIIIVVGMMILATLLFIIGCLLLPSRVTSKKKSRGSEVSSSQQVEEYDTFEAIEQFLRIVTPKAINIQVKSKSQAILFIVKKVGTTLLGLIKSIPAAISKTASTIFNGIKNFITQRDKVTKILSFFGFNEKSETGEQSRKEAIELRKKGSHYNSKRRRGNAKQLNEVLNPTSWFSDRFINLLKRLGLVSVVSVVLSFIMPILSRQGIISGSNPIVRALENIGNKLKNTGAAVIDKITGEIDQNTEVKPGTQ